MASEMNAQMDGQSYGCLGAFTGKVFRAGAGEERSSGIGIDCSNLRVEE